MIIKAQETRLKTERDIKWEKLPNDFQLPDDPVENLHHPLLASALREMLELAEWITPNMLIASNFGICATVNGKIVVKAPDWVYVPSVLPVPAGVIRRSYTPHAEGEVPAVVMEFLSDTEQGEYSSKSTYPYGKWYFYERVLQVPTYAIFDPNEGTLEVHALSGGRYELQEPDANQRYWIESMGLFLGVWHGTKSQITAYWLRWWDAS
ncbi:MAG TPA: Uma2 family endonuclease, partial [Allocoleopsis sp.]